MPHAHAHISTGKSRARKPISKQAPVTRRDDAQTPEEALIMLQRTIGNQAVMRFIQRTTDEELPRQYKVRPVNIHGTTPGHSVQRLKGWLKKRWREFKALFTRGGGGGGGVIAPPMGAKSMETDQQHGVPQTNDFSEEQLQTHMNAYRQARYYHATKVANATKIMESGGLDPNFRGKGGASEAENFDKEGANVTFLGGDHTTSLYYQNIIKGKTGEDVETLRPFLSKGHRDENLMEDFGDQDNLAYKTDRAIPSSQIVRGNLIDQSREKLEQVFAIVKEYYPENEQGISVDEVIRRHWECIGKGLTTHQAYKPSGKGIGFRGGERTYQGRDDRRMSF